MTTASSILVIDDDDAVGESLVEGLKLYGHAARWTTSLDDDDLAGFAPTIIVLDLNMPGCDGFSAMDRVARLAHQPSLIIASGQDQRVISAAVASARASGLSVLGALEKPYPFAELIRLIEARIGRPAATPPAPTALDTDLLRRQENWFEVLYQPKVRTDTLVRVGYEALLRPRAKGLTAEGIFAAPTPLDVQRGMTLAVIRRALQQIEAWSPRPRRLPVAVNCSPDVLAIDTIADDILRTLDECGCSPAHLQIELTEQESLQPDHVITRALARLKMAGIKVILDDFGKGSTSLERIIRYPIDEVKIDKELFWAGLDDPHTLQIIADVVAFCRSKGIASTFEGIESDAHLRVARQCMPDFCQGYLLGRPAALQASAPLQPGEAA